MAFSRSPPLAGGKVTVGVAKVVLGRGPVRGESVLGTDPQRQLVAVNGFLQILRRVAGGKITVGDAEVVLGHGPARGESVLGMDP